MQEPLGRSMAETLCEGQQRKGASPMDGARVTPRTDAESESPPGVAGQTNGVSHVESRRQNIYSPLPANHTFL